MADQEEVSLEFILILSYWYTYGKNTGYLHPIACTPMSAKVNAKRLLFLKILNCLQLLFQLSIYYSALDGI